MGDRVYLDHNASTPLDPGVLEAMLPYLRDRHGNASSIHSWGRELRKGVEEAREQVAALVGATPREIVFTSGGTEANNLAIVGAAHAYAGGRRKIVTTAVEHSSVTQPVRALAAAGYEAIVLPVGSDGRVAASRAAEALDESTLLVTVMLANNETGAVQPIAELARLTRERGGLFHTDAVQAPGKVPLDVRELGVDLLSLGGHKFCGPHGAGALYVRHGLPLARVLHGADQERGLRPGTHNAAAIVGLGEAARLARERGTEDAARMRALVAALEEQLQRALPGVTVNGPGAGGRLPNTLNARIPGTEAESLLLALDLEGIAVSAGSACHAGGVDPSPVLLAMGLSREAALSSLRISVGRTTTRSELDRFLDVLARVVARLRETPASGD